MPHASRNFLQPGDRVSRYDLVAEIARGGMAIVYAARLTGSHGFDRLFALKAVLPHLLDDPAHVRMFIDEARIASRIQHPNVVQVFDFGEHEGTPFLVMELLRGRSLHQLLRAAPSVASLPLGATLQVLGRAAEGLHAAHEAVGDDGRPLGVVHRDVSPQNIHVGFDGQVKVVDFGIAAARGRVHETSSGQIKGKLAYLAPEQIDRSAPVTRRADVWALAVTAWQALEGRPLFSGDDDADTMWRVLHTEVPRLTAPAPREVADAIAAALERDPEDRPADCGELARVFLRGAAELDAGHARQLADTMAAVFGDAEARERDRLLSATAPSAPGADAPVEAADAPRAAEAVSPRPRARWPLAVAGAAAVVGALVAAGFSLRSQADRPGPAASPSTSTETPPEAARPSAPAPQAAADPPPTRAIELRVDERATEVRVDGAAHPERPVIVELAEGQRVPVELRGPGGATARHEVDWDDHRRELRLPAPRRRRRERSRPPPNDILSWEEVN